LERAKGNPNYHEKVHKSYMPCLSHVTHVTDGTHGTNLLIFVVFNCREIL
jgi:hypothetical protein